MSSIFRNDFYPAIQYIPLVDESSSSDSSMKSATNAEDCVICWDSTGRDLITTDCNHTFDAACLATTLTYDQCCPMCRKPISEEIKRRLQPINSHIIQIVAPQRPVPNDCWKAAHILTICWVPTSCMLGAILTVLTIALYTTPYYCSTANIYAQRRCDAIDVERNKMIIAISTLFAGASSWLAFYCAWHYYTFRRL